MAVLDPAWHNGALFARPDLCFLLVLSQEPAISSRCWGALGRSLLGTKGPRGGPGTGWGSVSPSLGSNILSGAILPRGWDNPSPLHQ